MRIGVNCLFLIPGKVGGTEVYLRNLLRGLANTDKSNEYFLFANKENFGTFNINQDNFEEILCPFKAQSRLVRILWEQFFLPFQAKKYKTDILFSPGYTAPLIKFCPSVVVTHDMQYRYFPQDFSAPALAIMKILVPASAKSADKVVTLSNNSKKDIMRFCHIPEEKIEVTYAGRGTNFDFALQELEKVKEKFAVKSDYIIAVANFYPHKNIPRLLEAFKEVTRTRDVCLVLVGIKGRGYEEVMRKVDSLALGDKVVFTGRVSEQDLGALYKGARLFIFPSLYEGFGLPVLEAMSQEVPVVSSNAASLPEVVGDAGILFDPKNIEDMAAKIKLLLDDEKLRAELIGKGKKQVEKFSWENTAVQTLNVFKKLLAAK